MAISKTTTPQLDVETQLYLAEQSGQLSGPGYDIEALKAAGLVVPDPSSPIGVSSTGVSGVTPVPSVSSVAPITSADMPKLDVATQIYLAEQSGELSGPGWDIEQLKESGKVVPDKGSPIGVKPAKDVKISAPKPREGGKTFFQKEKADQTVPTTAGPDPLKQYFESKDAAWKDEYATEGGYDLLLMLYDALTPGASFTPSDLRPLFGDKAVNETMELLPGYRAYQELTTDYTREMPVSSGFVSGSTLAGKPLTPEDWAKAKEAAAGLKFQYVTDIDVAKLIDDKGMDGAISLLTKAGVEGAREFLNEYSNMPGQWRDYASQYGLDALQARVNTAAGTLKEYRQSDGSYDIYQALLDPKDWKEAAEHQYAISFLFGSEVTAQALDQLRTMRVEVTAPTPVPGGINEKGGVAEWFKGVKEHLTPWEEERGEDFIGWMQRPGTMIGDIRRRLTKDEEFKKWYDAQGYPDLVYGYGPNIMPAGGAAASALSRIPQAAGKAAKWYWTAPSRAVIQTAGKIPGLLKAPILGRMVPSLATSAVRSVTVGIPAFYTSAYIAEKVRDSDLQRKWNIFTSLPEKEKDKWAEKCGYDKWAGLTEGEQAAVLGVYAVPTSYTTTEWATAYGEYIEKMVEAGKKGADWLLSKQAPIPTDYPAGQCRVQEASIAGTAVKYGGAFGIGVGVGLAEGVIYMGAIPMILTNISVRVPTGEAWGYTKWVASGMMEFFKEVPGTFVSGPYGAGRMVGLFVLSPESVYKLSKGALTSLRPSYVPERAMGVHINTLRVIFTAKQLDLLAEMSAAELKLLGTRIGATLMKGKNYVKGFGRLKLEVKTVPYQKVVGNSLWHFTPNIKPFLKGKQVPIVGKLYTSPHAAISAGIQSLVKGTRATKPGLVEVRVPQGYTVKGAPIEKLLASGRAVEIEAPLKGELAPIKGLTGKGVSSNMYFGSYPIRRFTLQGVDTPIVKLTPKKLAQIRALAAKEAMADFFLGWSGRLEAVKKDVAANKQLRQTIKNVEGSIKAVKTSPDSVVGKNGEIVKQIEFKHPARGTVNEKVRGLIIDKDGRVLFTRDRADPVGVYDAVGGSCNPKQVLIPAKGKWNYQLPASKRPPITWELAFRSQAFGELNMVIKAKNTNSLGMYRGKTGEHAVYGVRTYHAKVDSPYFDTVAAWKKYQRPTYKYAEPEIAHAFWWDGKSKLNVQVQPWFYDMLAAVAKKYGWDMSKVKVSKVSGKFVRDLTFPERVMQGKNLDLTSKQRKAAEVGYLKDTYSRMMMPGFRDYLLRSGADITLMAELIKGHRQAVKWTSTSKTGDLGKAKDALIKTWHKLSQEQKANIDIAPLVRAFEAWKKSKTKANTKKLVAEINKAGKRYAAMANKWLMESNVRDYLDYGVISGRYSTYLDKLARASMAGKALDQMPIWSELPEYEYGDLPPMHYLLDYPAPSATRPGFTYTTGYSMPTYSELNQYPNYAKQERYQKTARYKEPSKYVTPTGKIPGYKTPTKTTHKKIPNVKPHKIPDDERVKREKYRRPDTPKKPPYERELVPLKGDRKFLKEKGLISWRQGAYWVSIFPPFRTKGTKPDVVYSKTKPPWAEVAKGKRSPRKSLKSIGKVPPLVELPMGVTTARVLKGDVLRFSRRKNGARRKSKKKLTRA